VVINERRQNYENRPYGLAQFALMEALFPPSHPYHWPTIGRPADLHAATLDDVRAFFRRYYHPANASLTIAGDVRTDQVIRQVETVFAEIEAGPPPPRLTPPPAEGAGRRLVLEDRVELPRLYMCWSSPALFSPGDAELDLIADIAANGRTSRLYARLIHDRRIAVELAAAQTSRELNGTFQLVATAAPGHTLDELEAAMLEEIDRLVSDGPSDAELERGRAQAEAGFVFRVQSLGGFGGKADQLNAYNIYRGAPDSFDADLARYLDVTGASLRETAGRWLDPHQAVVLGVVPAARLDLAPARADVAERPS
jgi:zinc protease